MKTNNLYIEEEAYSDLQDHLFKGESEQLAFLFARYEAKTNEVNYHVEEIYMAPEQDLDYSSPFYISLTDEALARMIKRAFDSGLVPIEVHSHRSDSFDPGFSASDFEGFKETVPHVRWRLQGRPYVAMVFAPSGFDGLVWKGKNEDAEGLDAMIVGDCAYSSSGVSIERLRLNVNECRFDRQMRLFGREGQEKLTKVEIAIVGLGGLGSHFVQQLAYLGIKKYRLLDGDQVEESNLNRLIGARNEDAEKETSKVSVARRMIEEIMPDASVVTFEDYFVTAEGFDHLRSVDIIVGAMDNDASRLILNEFAQAYRIPYLDVATDVDQATGQFGGRLLFSIDGQRCLSCEEELDQTAIDSLLSTQEERREKAEIYGIPEDALDNEAGPAVVSINGVLSSLAATELLMYVTGYRPVQTYLTYDGRHGPYGGVRFQSIDSEKDCYCCSGLYGKGRKARVEERYLANATEVQLGGRLAEM